MSSVDNAKIHDDAFERYRAYLHLLARTHLGDALRKKVDASDVVQQTLMQAYRDRDGFRGNSDEELAGWLKQILRNRLIEMARYWKGQKRDMQRDVELERKIADSFSRVDEWLVASQTSPSMRAHENDMLFKLPHAIEKLPDDLREAVVLHHLQGKKLGEIAEQLNCDRTTVGRRLMRGLEQLRRLMEK